MELTDELKKLIDRRDRAIDDAASHRRLMIHAQNEVETLTRGIVSLVKWQMAEDEKKRALEASQGA